jgi:hypothetical protein
MRLPEVGVKRIHCNRDYQRAVEGLDCANKMTSTATKSRGLPSRYEVVFLLCALRQEYNCLECLILSCWTYLTI